VKIWVSTMPWVAATSAGADDWGGYNTERQELAAYWQASGVGKLHIIGGDMHAVAADNGTNSAGAIPVAHGAALDQAGSTKGGPYSQGVTEGGGQFGWLDITDSGNQIVVAYTGRNSSDSVLRSMTTTRHPLLLRHRHHRHLALRRRLHHPTWVQRQRTSRRSRVSA
jgi:phosphodiesterase/alkaline phosphatase D-like protein